MDKRLDKIITQSIECLSNTLEQKTPDISHIVTGWMRSLAGGYPPEAYFKHPLAFPTLLLPWWVEESLGIEIDLEFQKNLVYSSINGYYFIRMIDNVMDSEATIEVKLLPSLAFFHTEFQTAYQKYFDIQHPFWALFRGVWYGTAQAAVHDAHLSEITLEMFNRASAQKVSAALIPIAAVLHWYDHPELIAPWSELVYHLGRWHQMFNDLFDWHKDLANGNVTYFLSQAKRLKRQDELVIAWIMREGFTQECDTMRGWMHQVKELASSLTNPSILHYLDERADLFDKRAKDSVDGFNALSKLSMSFA